MLKRIFSVSMLSLMLLTGCKPADEPADVNLPADKGTRLQQAKASGAGELTVLYVPAQGFAYVNQDNLLTGVSVEIMRDFAAWLNSSQQLSLTLNFVAEPDWNRFYQRVVGAEGGVFGLGNVAITKDRVNELQFSPPYLNQVALLITHSDIAPLPSLAQLSEHFNTLKPLAVAGTLHEVQIRALRDQYQPDADIGRVETEQQLLELIAAGAWYGYVDAYNLALALRQGMPLRHHPPAANQGALLGIIMPLNSDWALLLNDFFNDGQGYRNSKRYQQILQQHLGPEVAAVLEGARRTQP